MPLEKILPLVAGEAGASPQWTAPIRRRFAINVASLFSVQMTNMLLPLLTVPYVVRIIGPERLGLLNFSQAYIAYFTLLINYGFEMAAVRAIAADRTNRLLVDRVFSEVMTGKTLLWLVSTGAFAVLTWFVPDFRAHFWLHVCTYLGCLGVVLFPIWLYQAMEDLGRVAIFNLVVKVAFAGSVFIFIRRPEDYIYQNLSLSVAQLIVSVVALVVAFKRFGIAFTWPTVRQMRVRFRADGALFCSSVMITLYASSTVFMLGLLGTAYSVGIFSAGVRLESMARAFVALALNQAFFPIAARAFGESRAAGLAMIQAVFLPLLAFLAVISFGLWLIAPYFIRAFYGAEFMEAIPVLRIVAPLAILIGASNLLGFHTMINLRMDRAFFVITAIGSVIGVAGTVVLVKYFAHLGAAWAWVIAETYIALAMYIYLHCKGIRVTRAGSLKDALHLLRSRVTAYRQPS